VNAAAHKAAFFQTKDEDDCAGFVDKLLRQFDVDGDKKLSRDEFAYATIQIFFSLDKNEDLKISRDEGGPFWSRDASEADINRDSVLSLSEILRDENSQFESFDADHDGFLSRDELSKFVSKRLARQ
jgi:Ca2+-binding EF-hand superfamily protein